MNDERQTWVPSRWEQEFLWWLRVLMRYGVGGGGLVWETVVDNFHNSLALLVFGALATSTDVLSYVRDLIKDARAQKREEHRALHGDDP